MAADESEYIRTTQEQLGALIKKPPLTDKLLSKPPFRFLHDVVMAVTKQTGFMDGLYDGDEVDAQKVNNDKDAKVAFLQKAIDIVQMATGEPLAVKPAKVVAGQEPNRTNEFLQALAKAAKKGANADLVKRVLKGEKPELGASGDSGGSAGSNKENRERSETRKKDDKDSAKSKDSSKDGKKESKERSSSKDKSKEKSKEKEDAKAKSDTKEKSSKDKEKDKEKTRSSSKIRDGDDKKKKKEDDDGHKRSSSKSANATTKRDASLEPPEGDRKRRSSKSAKSSDDKKSDAKEEKSKKRQSSAAAKLDGDAKDDLANGEKESKKRSSSSKRDKEKDKQNDSGGGGLRIDLSSGHRNDGDIAEIDHRIEDESMNGGHEEERPRFASHSAKEGSRLDNDDQEATSSLKISGTIIRSGAARPGSAAGVRPGTAMGGRPGTAARAAPPRLKRQELGASALTESQSGGSTVVENGQAGTQPAIAPVVIQSDAKKAGQNNDDDEDFIVESREPAGVDALILNDEDAAALAEDIDGEPGEHGQLVRKILETKKELESQLKTTAASEKPLVVFDAQEREKTKKETGKLQELVQQLTRTSHPLAKIVDFLQEDVDSMLKELQQWKQEAKKDADLLRQETGTRNAAGVDIETLKNKLNELDQQIVEQSEAITAVRGVILNNEQRIQKMMSAVSKK